MVRAEGENHVTGAVIAQVDRNWNFIPGTEKHLDVDTICIAVGLSPMSQLARMGGCQMVDDPKRGRRGTRGGSVWRYFDSRRILCR